MSGKRSVDRRLKARQLRHALYSFRVHLGEIRLAILARSLISLGPRSSGSALKVAVPDVAAAYLGAGIRRLLRKGRYRSACKRALRLDTRRKPNVRRRKRSVGMQSARAAAAVTVMLALVGACSSESAGDNSAAETGHEQDTVVMNAIMNDPANPYAQLEMRLNARMIAARGVNASESWVRKMIEHHRAAIELANVFIAQGGDPQVLEAAWRAVQEHQEELAQLGRFGQALRTTWSGDADAFRDAERRMHIRMMDVVGTDAAEVWVRKMIEHHRGAVEMSNILLDLGGDPRVIERARSTARRQQEEIEELERMLRARSAAAAAS